MKSLPKIFALVCLSTFFSVLGQNDGEIDFRRVKIKKGVLLFNKKPVLLAEVDSKKKTIVYKSIEDNKKLFHVVYGDENLGDQEYMSYVEIYHPTNGKMNSVDFEEFIPYTLNGGVGATRFIYSKLNLLNENGLNQKAFDEFFTKDRVRESLSLKSKNAEDKIAGLKLIAEKDPMVNSELEVYYGGFDNLVGKIEFTPKGVQDKFAFYKVYNELDGVLVASAKANFMDGMFIETVDGKEFTFKKAENTDNGRVSGQDLIEKLITLGYSLDKHYRTASQYDFIEKTKNSPNIYKKKGFIEKPDGTRYSAIIWMLWENIIDPETEENDPPFAHKQRKNIGQKVYAIYKDEERGYVTKDWISSNSGFTFGYMDGDGQERLFKGIDGLEDVTTAIANMVTGSYRTNTFYEVIKSYPEMLIIKHPVLGFYGLKISNYDGILFTSNNREEQFERITAHTGCSFSEDVMKLNLIVEEDVLKMAEFYNSNCN